MLTTQVWAAASAADRDPVVLFYDMGATSTKVSLVRYHSSVNAVGGAGPGGIGAGLEVIGVAWDENLGGVAIAGRIGQLLVAAAGKRATRDSRASARLQLEANKAKEVRKQRR